MNIIDLLLIAVALSMDAFAVAICKGLSFREFKLKNALIIGLYFGVFQGLMPVVGYFAGTFFEDSIKNIDHWIAFGLLAIIGINMIVGAIRGEEESCPADGQSLSFKKMLPLAIATSIDALAVGISFALLSVNIAFAASLIGVVTFLLSAAGVAVGNFFGGKLKKKAEIVGGAILVLLGLKILLEHLGVL